jgi:hypothetical protein
MRWSDIPFSPPPRTLRQFAATWLVFLSALAAWEACGRARTIWAAVLAVLALTIGVLGLVRPRAIRLIFVGAMILAYPIGLVVSQVLLALVFFGLFLPVALIFRLRGRDALRLAPHKNLSTYWMPKTISADVRNYYRQF